MLFTVPHKAEEPVKTKKWLCTKVKTVLYIWMSTVDNIQIDGAIRQCMP